MQELLRTRVHNFEALEVLILASGDPKRAWTPAEAATALRWALEPAAQAFQRLQASGLLRSPSPDSYRFEPSTPAVGEAVSELRRCYAADRLAILKFMNSLSLEQMRNAMLRTLAEAFRLRRREP
ncbi:MAG TPA: hypothetical protein VFY71_05240 [Planctomycetota bacterium]|nr:hypothetical protein [Planctomycetota bacterium]